MPIRPEELHRYPADWKRISLHIRADRAKWQCECLGECGHDHNGRCVAMVGRRLESGAPVVLTVAHLNHTPEDCRPENLRAYCQACHLRYDAQHHAQTRAATRRRALAEAGQAELPLEAPRRIQRRRTPGWRAPDDAVYVGRGSRWGNQWRVARNVNGLWEVSFRGWAVLGVEESRAAARQMAVDAYREALEAGRLAITPLMVSRDLAGCDLMCWCPLDQPCHADILLEIANSQPAGGAR